MFTGIVTDIGEIVRFTPTAQGQLHRLRIAWAPAAPRRAALAASASSEPTTQSGVSRAL